MKKTRSFLSKDRYYFDLGPCSSSKGWAQIDSCYDASYYGTWTNPFDLQIFSYVEGDCCLTECDNIQEYYSELMELKNFLMQQSSREKGFKGIDVGLKMDIKERFYRLEKATGLKFSELLH